ncbi:MAG: PilZ domain-containing protein [Polyangiales bacterium]
MSNVSADPRDRRNPGSRVPFEALVEIAAPEGTSFEAESVDLSASGMHLRTAYLPKIGAPLTFRFDTENGGQPVVVRGEVVWSQDGASGGEFGVRFQEIAEGDAEVLRKIVGDGTSENATFSAGRSVRIHIEGMQAPMRATLRDEHKPFAVVGSDLKMLRLGALVELEDKERRVRRPARVDGVECEIDENTRIPQLVVKLRYEAMTAEEAFLPTKKVPMPADVETAAREVRSTLAPDHPAPQQRQSLPVAKAERDEEISAAPAPVAAKTEDEKIEPTSAQGDGMTFGAKMKIALGGAAAAASKLGARVGTTVSLLAKKSSASDKDDGEPRRTTAAYSAFMGGGSKARTLRPQSRDLNGSDEEAAMEEIDVKKVARRRQVGIAAGVGMAVILGFFAFRKPHPKEPVVNAPTPELAPASAAPVMAAAPAPSALAPAPADTVAAAAAPLVGDSTGVDAKGNPNPFGTPTVKKGTKMILRLDGPVAEIKGMQMPNGFVVSVPNRKSLEAAGPLAAKDPRISSAKVVNQPGGAELTIAFKDNSPNYVVKAKGDSLEIVLAHDKAVAKKNKGKNGGTPAAKPHKDAKKK